MGVKKVVSSPAHANLLSMQHWTVRFLLAVMVVLTPNLSQADTIPPGFSVWGTIGHISENGVVTFSEIRGAHLRTADMRPILTGRYKLEGVVRVKDANALDKLRDTSVVCGVARKTTKKNLIARLVVRLTRVMVSCHNEDIEDLAEWLMAQGP